VPTAELASGTTMLASNPVFVKKPISYDKHFLLFAIHAIRV
jgi:hypothetical protein